MAKITQLVDDIDGSSDDVETKKFEFQGVAYEVDLSDKNRAALDEALEAYESAVKDLRPFVLAGHEVKRPKPAKKSSSSAPYLDQIRAWAREQGMEVSDKGRIPIHIREAYDEAHPGWAEEDREKAISEAS